jgi:phospholipid transport system substrate-binding protein
MKYQKFGFCVALVGLYLLVHAHVNVAHANKITAGAEIFIKVLATTTQSTFLNKNLDPSVHKEKFRKIMVDNFDLKGVGRWVIGRYWRKSSPSERIKYLQVFENFIVENYAKRFKNYTKAEFKINKTIIRNNSIFVSSEINASESEPVRIVWRVNYKDGTYKIIDFLIEGVSWARTQRSEFASVIRNNGGKLSALISALNKKIIYLQNQR